LYVIFIHLIIFFFHIYFYMSPYICTYVFPFVIPYGLYKMRYRSIHMEIFNKNLGMILMRNKNLQRMCVCTTSQIKRVSKLKINFVENLGKLLFLKTSQFHYITYNIYYYISMIFLYLNYYIYLPILQFNSISEVNTSEHLLTSDVTLLIKEWCTSEHFVNTSEHLLTNIGGSL
jgi:hemolysin-activating ACP:hemolysin acyltransferase